MDDFTAMLRSRRDDAKRLLAASRQEAAKANQKVAKAEEDLRKWEAALALEEGTDSPIALSTSKAQNDGHWSEPHITKSPMARPALVPNARMKHEIFRNAFIEAGRPLTSAELMERLKPVLSERYIYYLRATLKKAGELEEVDGKLSLREKEGNTAQKN
jgi:hypothetical protein